MKLMPETIRDSMDIGTEKRKLRSDMKRRRGELDLASYRSWSGAITSSCRELSEFRSAARIHCYVSSLNNEVETLGIIFAMFDTGKTVTVPVCVEGSRKLISIAIRSLDELRPTGYGLMEPEYNSVQAVPSNMLDLVIVPLVAFDRNGNRLGMGGGYYDSFLAECACPKVGLAYAFQEVEQVPVEPHDMKLDIIITDREVIRLSHAR